MTTDIMILYSFATITVLISTFCSLAEASVVAMTEIHTKRMGDKKALSVRKILLHKHKYLSAIITLNTIVNISFPSLLAGLALMEYSSFGHTFFIIGLTVVMLLFSEIKPKIYAANNPEIVIKYIHKPLVFITWILTPVVNLINGLLNNKGASEKQLNIDELMHFINTASETGLINIEEAGIIKNIVDLKVKTSDVIITGKDITMMSISSSIGSVKEELMEVKHRRIILVNKDNKPVGMFFKEHALKCLIRNELDTNLSEIMHPLPVVDPKTPVTVLARRLQKSGSHLAIVMDEETGDINGVVSLTDIKGLIFS